MEKKRVSVQIDGRSYVVVTEDDEAYVREVAQTVSDSLLRASRSGKNLDVRDCAILVALDCCDDSMKAKRRNRALIEKADLKETAVMVGDTEFDITGAKQTGLDGIGVTWGYGTKESMKEAGADGLADTMDELYTLITAE